MFTQGYNVLRTFLTSEAPPNKVIDIRSDSFNERGIYTREDGLVLYLPHPAKKDKTKAYHEIALHRPCSETMNQSYSLYRSTMLDDAETKFLVLKDKLPALIEISKELYNIQGLQKICDTLDEHQAWTLAHLAAHFSLYDAFNNSKVNCFLNSTDIETGMSPLQVAITTQSLKTVQILVTLNCSLEHLDYNGNSVFHYAASTTKDIISVLTQNHPQQSLNARNKNGHTPLHMACLADKQECVKALLVAGADVNKKATTESGNAEAIEPGYVGVYIKEHPNSIYQKDMKYGGTPLHWSSSRPVIDALIDMNCHIDAVNFEQKTALHIMVARNRLDCVVALLSRDANLNLGDCDGNRPIHLAVKVGVVAIIQSLIVFGADLDVLNNAGESARHIMTAAQEPKLLYLLHAVGAKRCDSDMTNCTDGCIATGNYSGIPPPRVVGPTNRDILDQMLATAAKEIASKKHNAGDIPKKKGRLLSLDGGGIRGLILIVMLLEIENIAGQSINRCFDWLAGTSTGGIICLAIATGKSMKECLCLYFRLKESTFVGMRPYASEALETILKDTFGADTVMSDIRHPKVMVTGVLADRKPVELHLFRNYECANDILNVQHDTRYELPHPPEEQFVWQVGRATGAAPTYFRSFGRFLDGGLIANNPTLDAMTEVQEHCLALKAMGREDEGCPLSVVVSLGTGLIPVTQLKEIDVFRPEKLWDSAKLVFGISTLGTLLVDQATASDGRVVDRARAWCSTIGVSYFRFSPQMSEDVGMDEKSDEILCNMLWETKAYMHSKNAKIKELTDVLLN